MTNLIYDARPQPGTGESPVRSASVPERLDSYRGLVAELSATAVRRDADLAAADAGYAAGVAAAEAAVADLAAAALDAERRVAAAAADLVRVDGEADRIWNELRRALGWRAWAVKALPAPADAGPGANARELLARAAGRIGTLRRERPRRPLPWLLLPLLPPLGAAVATMVGLVAGGLATLGQGGTGAHLTLRLIGYAVFLLAPFAGIPVAVFLADRRLACRLDTGAIALIVLGGMTAGCALSLALR